MPYKLKSNEEITKAFDKEELKNVQRQIRETQANLYLLQKIHTRITGKEYTFYTISREK